MPELAEVEHARRRWNPGLGFHIVEVQTRADKRVFRDQEAAAIKENLLGLDFARSLASGKQIAFIFTDPFPDATSDFWLGIHLGMTGRLRCESDTYRRKKHDHLVLHQRGRKLVFEDSRMFGRVRFTKVPIDKLPDWWAGLAPDILSDGFTLDGVAGFLRRRPGRPLKAVLLMQEMFPGIGNWMADEILWRSRLAPDKLAGTVTAEETASLFQATRAVAEISLETIPQDSEGWTDPPPGWLFHVRWDAGLACPRCGAPLKRADVGGRTTCWCAECQLA